MDILDFNEDSGLNQNTIKKIQDLWSGKFVAHSILKKEEEKNRFLQDRQFYKNNLNCSTFYNNLKTIQKNSYYKRNRKGHWNNWNEEKKPFWETIRYYDAPINPAILNNDIQYHGRQPVLQKVHKIPGENCYQIKVNARKSVTDLMDKFCQWKWHDSLENNGLEKELESESEEEVNANAMQNIEKIFSSNYKPQSIIKKNPMAEVICSWRDKEIENISASKAKLDDLNPEFAIEKTKNESEIKNSQKCEYEFDENGNFTTYDEDENENESFADDDESKKRLSLLVGSLLMIEKADGVSQSAEFAYQNSLTREERISNLQNLVIRAKEKKILHESYMKELEAAIIHNFQNQNSKVSRAV